MTKKQDNHDVGDGVDLIDHEKEKDKLKPPSKYKVVMHNDNYTPMEVVAAILISIFKKGPEIAWKLTMDVHEKGKGIAGIYPKGIAETKIDKAMTFTKSMGFPFLLTLEKE